ncbi:MAG: citrate synthase [Candidatus Hydrogenedentes bacterium]|nr:citrate synthase [Candidatus Hydrogenedentota bacterium]
MSEAPSYSPGLAGVIAGRTTIGCVDQGELLYRGYPIQELAQKTCFEEVAYLLLHGELPNELQLAVARKTLYKFATLPDAVLSALRTLPKEANMMDVLRSMVSLTGHFDPVRGDGEEADRQRAYWLTAQISSIIAARFRLLKGLEPVPAKDGLGHAANLLYMCHGAEPTELEAGIVDLTLVLYAEHDFNASTFAARVITSTRSDIVSAVVGGIGALKGPLHGGANEAAMDMLQRFTSGEEAATWVREALSKKQLIMGFGHRVYRNGDHRARILEEKLRELAKQLGADVWMEIYDAIKKPMVEEKKIFPNVDYPCGLVYYLLNLPIDVYTPLFVAARITGWSAHILEQKVDDRIFRPLSIYEGPKMRSVPALKDRP